MRFHRDVVKVTQGIGVPAGTKEGAVEFYGAFWDAFKGFIGFDTTHVFVGREYVFRGQDFEALPCLKGEASGMSPEPQLARQSQP